MLAIARQMYGSAIQNMTLELNASDDRGISIVRQEIQDFASTRCIFRSARWPGCCTCSCHVLLASTCDHHPPLLSLSPESRAVRIVCRCALQHHSLQRSNKFKLVILDECDAMTKDAQFALRRGMHLLS